MIKSAIHPISAPVAFMTAMAATAFGADLHVAPPPLGDDSNDGTLANPLATITQAEREARKESTDFDRILIHGGVYRESVVFGASEGSGQPLVVQPYDDGSGPDQVTVSGFDLIEPDMNGVGNWEQHDGPIFKIQLTPAYGLASDSAGVSSDSSTVLVDGIPQKIARWPNAPAPFDFDWKNMAAPESAPAVNPESGGPELPYAGTFYTATYQDIDLPYSDPDELVGALIDLSPGSGVHPATGIVTASGEQFVTFRYKRDSSSLTSEGDPYFIWNTLAVLDEEGEYFFDSQGVVAGGEPHTLYLWGPGGESPSSHIVEIKTREYAFEFNRTSPAHVEKLGFLGGGLHCTSSSSSISMHGLALRYCGSGLNYLRSEERAAIWLEGSDHSVTDCTVEDSYGGGVLTIGANNQLSNNVICDCLHYAIGTWGSSDNTVAHNTVFGNGGENITMFSPRSTFNYNHCYHSGLRLSDIASMNSNYNGDLDNMQVAYNWVHDNVSRLDLDRENQFKWLGGSGIRMDTSPSNASIHHNLIWGISQPAYGLVLFSLDASQVNHQDSMLRAYNNTIDGQITFPGKGSTGSIGGHDVRNNICTEIREFDVQEDGAPFTIDHNCLTIGRFVADWPGPGNFVSGSLSVSASTGNFELHPGSDAIDAGVIIPGYTDGFHGTAPDIGALESGGGGNPNWSAGALLRPEDGVNLRYSVLCKPDGSRYVVVSGMPIGRVPDRDFQVRLGGTTLLEDHRLVYSTSTHTAQAYFEVADPSVVGVQEVEFALSSHSFHSSGAPPLELPAQHLTLDSSGATVSPEGGGAVSTVTGSGIRADWMLPVQVRNAQGLDLSTYPIPVVFDSREQVAAGRMRPDCSDLRVVHRETGQELDYWIESGRDTPTTLLWLRFADDRAPLTGRFSHLDESTYYLTFGDPLRPSASDPAVILDSYPELNLSSLQVWVSANRLDSDLLQNGDAIHSWPNDGAGSSVTQADASLAPSFHPGQIGGLPSVRFDGSDYLSTDGFPSSIAEGYTTCMVMKVGPSNSPTGRLISIGSEKVEQSYVRIPESETAWHARVRKRAYDGGVSDALIGRWCYGENHFITADIAELLFFSEVLSDGTGTGSDRVERYLKRKYRLGTTPYGMPDPASLLAPTRFTLGGQPLEVVIHDERTASFTVPALNTLSEDLNLPQAFVLEAVSGSESAQAPEWLVYFDPAYQLWSLGLPPESRGELDDPDGDGLTNMIEFGTGSDALAMNPVVLDWSPGGTPDSHVLRFPRNLDATDVLLWVDYSTDLVDWIPLFLNHPSLSIADPDLFGDGSTVLYEVAPVDPAAPHAFFRLSAMRIEP